MSEIICTYQFNNDSGYFIFDSGVSFLQFSQFIADNITTEDVKIFESQTNQEISNDEEMQTIFAIALSNQGAISINLEKQEEEPEYIPLPEEIVQNEEEQVEEEERLLGPITQSLLDKFEIEIDENEIDLGFEFIVKQIPFPFSMIVQSQINNLLNNESLIDEYVSQFAPMLEVNAEEFSREIKTTIRKLKDRLNKPKQQEEEIVKEEPQPFIGPITQSILDRFEIEIDENEIDLGFEFILKQIPFPFSFMLRNQLNNLLQNEDCIDGCIGYFADLIEVDGKEFAKEIKNSIRILKEKINNEQQQQQEEEQPLDEIEVIVKVCEPQKVEEAPVTHKCYV